MLFLSSLLLSVPLRFLMGLEAPAGLLLHSVAAVAEPPMTRVASATVRLSEPEIQLGMATVPDWERVGEALVYERRFEDFVAAIAFINNLVEPSETLGHHPEIAVNYNHVTLRLTTHDADGLTQLDFQLASLISQLQP